jgi:hypothetical protein
MIACSEMCTRGDSGTETWQSRWGINPHGKDGTSNDDQASVQVSWLLREIMTPLYWGHPAVLPTRIASVVPSFARSDVAWSSKSSVAFVVLHHIVNSNFAIE